MTPIYGKPSPICIFETNESEFESWASKNQTKLTECLLHHSASIRSYNRTDYTESWSNIDFLTTTNLPIQVEFNDGLVTIKKIQ